MPVKTTFTAHVSTLAQVEALFTRFNVWPQTQDHVTWHKYGSYLQFPGNHVFAFNFFVEGDLDLSKSQKEEVFQIFADIGLHPLTTFIDPTPLKKRGFSCFNHFNSLNYCLLDIYFFGVIISVSSTLSYPRT